MVGQKKITSSSSTPHYFLNKVLVDQFKDIRYT